MISIAKHRIFYTIENIMKLFRFATQSKNKYYIVLLNNSKYKLPSLFIISNNSF